MAGIRYLCWISVVAIFGCLTPVHADEISDLKNRIAALEAAQHVDCLTNQDCSDTCGEPTWFTNAKRSTSVRVGGYAKLDGIFDFDDAGNRFLFDPNSIPIGSGGGEQVTFHARQTRLNFESKTETDLGQFRTFIEGDFFGDDNAFRLRHGYGQLGNLLGGQTWILAVDADAIPETLDFNGPDGGLLIRRAQARWTMDVDEDTSWAISLHDPGVNIQTTVPGQNRDRIPVLSSAIRCRHDSGHFYLYGGMGESRFLPSAGGSSEATVWGAGFSAMQRVGEEQLILQFGVAEGFQEFLPGIQATANSIVAPAGTLDPLLSYGWVAAWQHPWNEVLRSNATYRSVVENNNAQQPGDSVHRNHYLAANLIWSPLKTGNVDLGVEYLWGLRENKNGSNADAHRLQFSAIFRIP